MRGTPKKFALDRNVIILRVVLLLLSFAMVTELWASGWPPFAQRDEISVVRGGTATVLDSGANSVLANDFDIERDPMTAIVTRDPRRGQVTLNPDGTFVYVHDGSKQKDDDFSYVAFDGTSSSREARVRIDVEDVPNNPPFTTGSPPDQEASDGIFYRIALANYFSDLDEGDSLRFSASGLPSGNRLQINANSGVLSGTPNASDAREQPYIVGVTATDNVGASARVEFRLTIFVDSRSDLDLTATVVVNPVTVGEIAQWNIDVQNRGPGDLEEGELVADWATSGPTLSLTAPPECNLEDNESSTPTMRCSVDGLSAGSTASFTITGTQSSDGDSSLIAIVNSDDPNPSNNASLTAAVVVAAFSEGPSQVIDTDAFDVDSGDLNGDGALDVIVTAGETRVYFNSGSRTVTTPGTSLGPESGGSAVVVMDWDGDGVRDIAVVGMNNRAGRIYLNDGTGEFFESIDLNVSGLGDVRAAAAADFDQDGDDDLVIAGTGDAILVHASGPNGFATSMLPAVSGMDATITDINSDGLDDIVIVQSSNRRVRIMRNSGDGRLFTDQSLDRGSVASVTAEDIDRDGDVDLLLAVDDGELTAPQSKVVYQQSDESFSNDTNLGASPLSKMLSGDINADGVPDVIAINASGVHQLYEGLTSGGFSLLAEQIVSDGMRRGVLTDFNGDGSLDLIFTGIDAGVIEIHANNGLGRLGLGDRVAPEVFLNGEATLNLASGVVYEELGVTAMDDIDGDVSNSMVVSGTVNTGAIGTYTLTYTVSDKATNSASIQRTVNVGINQGTGGGGGIASPLFVVYLMMIALWRRRY